MAFVYSDRVKEQSSSLGLTSMVLSGALPGFQTFLDGIQDTNQTYYTIVNNANNTWEVGSGTYSSGTNSLSRDTVLASSNSNNPVNFASGTKTVFSTIAAAFFGAVLTASSHATLNHTGIPGVGGAETFTAGDHNLVDHTAVPFQLLDVPGHQGVDHTLAPFSLLNAAIHALIDHTGFPGINDFDSAMHAVANHSGLPGVPPAESFTNPVHAATDHTGIPGVGGGGGTPPQARLDTLTWSNESGPKVVPAYPFTPVCAITFSAFHTDRAGVTSRGSTVSIGAITPAAGAKGVAESGIWNSSSSDHNAGYDENAVAMAAFDPDQAANQGFTTNFAAEAGSWEFVASALAMGGVTITPQGGAGNITGKMFILAIGS